MGEVTFDTQAGTWSWSFNTTDGPDQTQTVTLTATLTGGAQSPVTFNLIVNNVAPSLTLSGNAEVDEQAPYVLTLSGLTNPGADIVTGYRIRWGDNQSTGIIPMPPLPVQVEHVYATSGTYTIHVDLYDEDGNPHLDRGLFNVLVRDVTPPGNEPPGNERPPVVEKKETRANLTVTHAGKPNSARRLGRVTFRITVANRGNASAYGVFVTYQLPAGLVLVANGSTSGWMVDGTRRFRLHVGTLAEGQSVTLEAAFDFVPPTVNIGSLVQWTR